MIPEIKINDTCMMVEKVRLTATVMGVLDNELLANLITGYLKIEKVKKQ